MDFERQVKLFKALGDPTRLCIINLLSEGELCVCEIIPKTGKSQPTTSAHLKILYEAGLVRSRKEGLSVYYRLSEPGIMDLIKKGKDMVENKP